MMPIFYLEREHNDEIATHNLIKCLFIREKLGAAHAFEKTRFNGDRSAIKRGEKV